MADEVAEAFVAARHIADFLRKRGGYPFTVKALDHFIEHVDMANYRWPDHEVIPKWQSIETAPKNGEPIHLYIPINTPDRRILTGYWTDAGWWICSGSIILGKPSHWMPLACPPVGNSCTADSALSEGPK